MFITLQIIIFFVLFYTKWLFSLKPKCQKVSTVLQDFSQYSSRSLDGFSHSFNFPFYLSLFNILWDSFTCFNNNWYHFISFIFNAFFRLLALSKYLPTFYFYFLFFFDHLQRWSSLHDKIFPSGWWHVDIIYWPCLGNTSYLKIPENFTPLFKSIDYDLSLYCPYDQRLHSFW